MNIIQAALLGLIQGLTEFLPVSSSGHLVLFRNIFGITSDPLVFEILLHVGTLFSVCLLFRKDLWYMIKHPFSKQTLYLIIATIPAVIAALFFDDFIEETFKGATLGFEFLITAAILCVAELVKHKKPRPLDKMKTSDAVSMGVMQAVSILPGISRSGATIVGGMVNGLERVAAARFAFLMSVPAILGSLVFKIKDLLEIGTETAGLGALIAGPLVAALAGIFAIRFMLKQLEKRKLYVFAIYVFIIGALILLDQYVTHLVF